MKESALMWLIRRYRFQCNIDCLKEEETTTPRPCADQVVVSEDTITPV